MFREVRILPIRMNVEGYDVTILEVVKSKPINKDTWYHVVCYIEQGNKRTRIFSIDCRSWDEFKKKIKIEVSRLKIMRLLMGEKVWEILK